MEKESRKILAHVKYSMNHVFILLCSTQPNFTENVIFSHKQSQRNMGLYILKKSLLAALQIAFMRSFSYVSHRSMRSRSRQLQCQKNQRYQQVWHSWLQALLALTPQSMNGNFNARKYRRFLRSLLETEYVVVTF